MAQRRITVDRSGQAAFSLRVVLDGDSSKALAGIRVTGSTWLYMWRSRFTSVITGASGEAQSHVEALAQASTHYTFRVDPTVVDGVLYEGVEPVTVTLAPGATSVPPIALKVRSRTGQISGTLLAPPLPRSRLSQSARFICLTALATACKPLHKARSRFPIYLSGSICSLLNPMRAD
jgi:hypothetical protein